jgi:ribosomal protein S14
MVGMTSPAATAQTTQPPVRRLALVRNDGRSEAAVRRFRLARLRLEDREVARSERFAYLKRGHD